MNGNNPGAQLWGVLKDGALSNQLFPSQDFAKAAALGLTREYPSSLIEICQVKVELTMRRSLPRRLVTPR